VVTILSVSASAGLAGAPSPQEKAPIAPAPPAASQSAEKQAAQKPAQPWSVNCANTGQGLACKALQSIVLANTRQLLLSVSVSKSANDKTAAMLLHLPHGLFNPAGVTIAIDEEAPESLVIQTCDAKGCYAGNPLTPETLQLMTKGTKLNVVFQDLKKQKITVPVPLKGFEDAYKKL
jgi:invasion protein IalB